MSTAAISATGRRKNAVARVRLKAGSGLITVNERPFEDYFPSIDHQNGILAPLQTVEAAKKFEKVVAEGLEQIRAQSRTYADNAGEHIDDAQRYVVERVKERPLVATGAALGVGLLIGLLLASGRKN